MQGKLFYITNVLAVFIFVNHTCGQSLSSVNRDQFKLGTFPPADNIARLIPVQSILRENDTIPLFFDARQKWPNFIHPPEDQGNCSGSWAFSTAGVAADRVAIQSNGIYTGKLSVQQLLSCVGKDGCSGGYIDRAWQFTRNNSILADACYERIESGFAGKCVRSLTSINGPCDGGLLVYIRMTPPYRIRNKEEDIMIEIMYNGPVQIMMAVTEDFYRYRSGIYRYPTGIRLEQLNHSVKIIGWGEERLDNGENRKYWICVNSWGKQWGENGTFKVERGAFEELTVIVAAHLSLFRLKGTPTEGSIESLGNEFSKILDRFVFNNIQTGEMIPEKYSVRVEWQELAQMFREGRAGISGLVYSASGAKAALYDALERSKKSLPITQNKFIRTGRISFRRKKIRKTE